ADVDAFPVCLDTKDPDEIVQTVRLLAPCFGGINLEDISSPRCFEIESRLIEELDIPVFHDDQHGTAIVVLAALLNACRLTGRSIENLRVAMVGAGAAGVAVAKILMNEGVASIIACDRTGAIHAAREDYLDGSMNTPKTWLAENTNLNQDDGVPATQITEEMKVAAAHGIASVIPEDELSEEYIVPSVFNREVSHAVAEAVSREAMQSGVARGPRQLTRLAHQLVAGCGS